MAQKIKKGEFKGFTHKEAQYLSRAIKFGHLKINNKVGK